MNKPKRDFEWWLMIASFATGIFLLIGMLPALGKYTVPAMVSGISIALLVLLGKRIQPNKSPRKCLSCGYDGPMETVLWSLSGGLISFILIMTFLIPGIIYIIWRWNAPKCPRCGSVRKSVPLQN